MDKTYSIKNDTFETRHKLLKLKSIIRRPIISLFPPFQLIFHSGHSNHSFFQGNSKSRNSQITLNVIINIMIAQAMYDTFAPFLRTTRDSHAELCLHFNS